MIRTFNTIKSFLKKIHKVHLCLMAMVGHDCREKFSADEQLFTITTSKHYWALVCLSDHPFPSIKYISTTWEYNSIQFKCFGLRELSIPILQNMFPPEFEISQFWGWIKSPRSQFHSLLWFFNTQFQLIELRISISRFVEVRGETVSVGVEKPFDLFIVVTLVLQLVHVHVLPRSMFFSMISFYQYLTLRAVVKKTKVFLRSGWP